MQDLTFGEQVKIVLGRRGMTIKELAEKIEEKTGKKMSRQNLTQRLGRDNFQEQDMRMIAQILDCPFQLNIMEEEPEEAAEAAAAPKARPEKSRTAGKKTAAVEAMVEETAAAAPAAEEPARTQLQDAVEREVTVGEFLDAEAAREETAVQKEAAAREETAAQDEAAQKDASQSGTAQTGTAQNEKPRRKAAQSDTAWAEAVQAEAARKREAKEKAARQAANPGDAPTQGEINPYTGREYESNSVRMHPKRIGYVQVYDQDQHQWIDMTEWAFLGYEERKKTLMGDRYVPPIYLD